MIYFLRLYFGLFMSVPCKFTRLAGIAKMGIAFQKKEMVVLQTRSFMKL